ncbi:MAG: bifunctional riboflavin kinase/FAD synthetase [Bacteroidetes bacterium]|nr:bifunctional riboflavin kinase/FAD synthetase [Bacteroidota bacterium]
MDVFRSLESYTPSPRTVATIGTFDGVHPGHRAILQRLVAAAHKQQGTSLVITFHPHPRLVLHPQDNPLRLLHTLEEKISHLAAAGVDRLLVLPFTPAFAQTDSQVFITEVLHRVIGAQHIVIGYDHRFGKGRGGGLAELRQLGPQLGFTVEEIPAQEIDAAKVSSTRIREALLAGHVAEAHRLLGYPYSLEATVVHGDKRGRQLGFPTANLELRQEEPKLLPANGVYAVEVLLPAEKHMGMMNIGNRPTVDGLRFVPEVHLLDFSGDLYGQSLRVGFRERIRDEQRFGSLDELVAQLSRDRDSTRALLSTLGN